MGDLVAKAASAIPNAIGAGLSGSAEQSSANAQKRIARQNAEIAERNAELTMAMGDRQEEQFGLKTRAVAGAIKGAQSGSGVDMSSGSSQDVLTSQRILNQMDVTTLRSNAAREAFGFKTKAKAFRNEAALAKARANQAGVATAINVWSSLAGGGGADAMRSIDFGGDEGGHSMGGDLASDAIASLAF